MSEQNETYTKWQHEREMTRLETQCKRWFIAFMVVLVMLFGTNIAWVIYENSFQNVVVTQDGFADNGGRAYFNGTGEMDLDGRERTPDNPDPGEEGQY